jgi:DDE superfamily endonuclease
MELAYQLLDEFPVHLTSKVGTVFVELNTEIEVIPGGYTSKLQVLDVGINKPLKTYCWYPFNTWMDSCTNNTRPRCRAVSWNKVTLNHIGYLSFDFENDSTSSNSNKHNNDEDKDEFGFADNNNVSPDIFCKQQR